MGEDQAAVIRFLSQPAAYGAAGPVERIDTHASIVFLVGDRAYKMKRAVAFSYLDYSTLERRERFCREELRLNRRTAPGLYRGLAAVTREADGRLALDGQGPAVEWLVAMRRFDEADRLDRVAARGGLTRARALALAERVAAFHEAAERTPDLGGRRGIAEAIEGNAKNLALAVEAGLDAAMVARVNERSRSRLHAVGDLLERRRLGGQVRACHGDLHLGNICLLDGQPTLFDGIEFDPWIAGIDLLYDLAFLLMDLGVRNLPMPANAVFNRYLDRVDTADGLPALPLFLSLRAAIRAHVGVAAAARQADARERAGRLAEAGGYLAFADAMLAPAAPRLIAVGGLSGTGKSTLAYGLAPDEGRTPGARVLRSDVLRKRLFGRRPEERLPPAAYDRATTERVYAALAAATAAALRAGATVIADAVFARPEERAAIEAVAHRAGVSFAGIWLAAPPAVLERRIAARRGDASDATVAVLRQQLAFDLGPIAWHRLEASAAADRCLAAARALLDGPRR